MFVFPPGLLRGRDDRVPEWNYLLIGYSGDVGVTDKSRVYVRIWCVYLSNSKLQTRCSGCNREDNASGCLIGEELFPSPGVYHCLCFLSNLQISSSQIIVLSPFFVSLYLSYRSEVSPWRQVVLPQFWLPRRDSTFSNRGRGGLKGSLFDCGIIMIDKARAKGNTYIWVSV